MFLLQGRLVRFPHELGGRILHIESRTSGEHSSCFRRMELFSRNRRLPCVEEQYTLALEGLHVEMSCILVIG